MNGHIIRQAEALVRGLIIVSFFIVIFESFLIFLVQDFWDTRFRTVIVCIGLIPPIGVAAMLWLYEQRVHVAYLRGSRVVMQYLVIVFALAPPVWIMARHSWLSPEQVFDYNMWLGALWGLTAIGVVVYMANARSDSGPEWQRYLYDATWNCLSPDCPTASHIDSTKIDQDRSAKYIDSEDIRVFQAAYLGIEDEAALAAELVGQEEVFSGLFKFWIWAVAPESSLRSSCHGLSRKVAKLAGSTVLMPPILRAIFWGMSGSRFPEQRSWSFGGVCGKRH